MPANWEASKFEQKAQPSRQPPEEWRFARIVQVSSLFEEIPSRFGTVIINIRPGSIHSSTPRLSPERDASRILTGIDVFFPENAGKHEL
jgi:hypothetical protein